MKNKIMLKKYLLCSLILILIILGGSVVVNIIEFNSYNKNINYKIVSFINEIKSKYPDVSEKEIMEILNSENFDEDLFNKYSLNINENILIAQNEKDHIKFIIINTGLLFVSIITLMCFFIRYDNKKEKEIKKITKCIEAINKRNYKLELDDISEDELSILKNEIYKTTIILKEAAENSNKEKLELKNSLSDISHQLKTPLTSILIILDNLIDDPNMDKETRTDFIKDIKREITNISFLVQAILKLSKLDTNTIIFTEQNVLVKDIIKEVINNLAMLSDLKNITFNLKIDEKAKIKCDFKWQVEAISNIVKNCIEYADDNSNVGIEVTSNKVYTEIIILDQGKKIDKEDINHIFERFYKGKNSLQDSIGIGLSLAKALIEKDNGKISVESNNNETKFIIKYIK